MLRCCKTVVLNIGPRMRPTGPSRARARFPAHAPGRSARSRPLAAARFGPRRAQAELWDSCWLHCNATLQFKLTHVFLKSLYE